MRVKREKQLADVDVFSRFRLFSDLLSFHSISHELLCRDLLSSLLICSELLLLIRCLNTWSMKALPTRGVAELDTNGGCLHFGVRILEGISRSERSY